MSYTTIKAIWPGERHEDLQELRNGHGSAPVIWGALCERYLGGNRNGWLFNDELSNKLWSLWQRQDVPLCMRAVLMMTFDRFYVERKDYARAASDIDEFLRIAPPPPGHINHWPTIADLFRSNPDIPAVGFHCTSVSEDPFQGDLNEESGEYAQPDWSKCHSVYDELAKAEQNCGQPSAIAGNPHS